MCSWLSQPCRKESNHQHLQRVLDGGNKIHGNIVRVDIVSTAGFSEKLNSLVGYYLGGLEAHQNRNNYANLQRETGQRSKSEYSKYMVVHSAFVGTDLPCLRKPCVFEQLSEYLRQVILTWIDHSLKVKTWIPSCSHYRQP